MECNVVAWHVVVWLGMAWNVSGMARPGLACVWHGQVRARMSRISGSAAHLAGGLGEHIPGGNPANNRITRDLRRARFHPSAVS